MSWKKGTDFIVLTMCALCMRVRSLAIATGVQSCVPVHVIVFIAISIAISIYFEQCGSFTNHVLPPFCSLAAYIYNIHKIICCFCYCKCCCCQSRAIAVGFMQAYHNQIFLDTHVQCINTESYSALLACLLVCLLFRVIPLIVLFCYFSLLLASECVSYEEDGNCYFHSHCHCHYCHAVACQLCGCNKSLKSIDTDRCLRYSTDGVYLRKRQSAFCSVCDLHCAHIPISISISVFACAVFYLLSWKIVIRYWKIWIFNSQ